MAISLAKISPLVDKLRSFRTGFAALAAMFMKAGGSLLTLVIFTIAARAMAAEDFGRLAIWFNALAFLGVASCFGQDTLIARSFGEYAGKGDFATAWAAYRYGWIRAVASAITFAAGLYFIAPLWFPTISRTALLAGSMFLLTQTCLHYSSHSSRVMVNFVISEINRELTWRAVLLSVVIFAVLTDGLTPAQFFFASAIGQAMSLIWQLIYVRRTYLSNPPPALNTDKSAEWGARARTMWISAMMEAVGQYADVMLIGFFASPTVAGDYFVAARIASIFILISGGIATYSFAHAAILFFSGQVRRLQDILRSMALACALLSTLLIVLVIVFGDHIVMIFGARYASVYPTLVALSLGAYIMALAGTPSVLLLTTGHERIYSRILAAGTALRLLATSVLAILFGPLGAACGWAMVNAPMTMLLSRVCVAKLGVDPSILSVLRLRKADEEKDVERLPTRRSSPVDKESLEIK